MIKKGFKDVDLLTVNYFINDIGKRIEEYRKELPEVVQDRIELSEVGQDRVEISEIGQDIIFYGAPGCGKSYLVDKIVQKKYKENYERILFHPEYSYSDFVGQILPDVKGTNIEYKFKAGPFTRILKKALNNENEQYCLIIEEINRGNASSIFGDIFQLLDRRKKTDEDSKNGYKLGDSQYAITNKEIFNWLQTEEEGKVDVAKKLVGGEKIYIPHNLSIYATMNTSDQNVFILDTAFKRRWKLVNVPIDFSKEDNLFTMKIPGDEKMQWKEFAETLNKWIPKVNNSFNSDDKLIGQYFVTEDDLKDTKDFAQKIFLYLWNDVVKMNKYEFFKNKVHDVEINTLSDLINAYEKYGLEVFDKKIFEINEDDALSNEKEEENNE